jgi:hypothetical protein
MTLLEQHGDSPVATNQSLSLQGQEYICARAFHYRDRNIHICARAFHYRDRNKYVPLYM